MSAVKSKTFKTLCLLGGAIVSTSSMATNGYFTHGVSTAEKGLAGAGVAFSQDSLAAANNPAGMVWQSERLDVGAALFAPSRSYTVTGNPSGFPNTFPLAPGTVNSENESFIIPQYGQNWMLDSDRSIGISIYGNGGMNTEYKAGSGPGTFGAGKAGVNLEQLFIATTYAAKISDSASWGVTGIIVYQKFEATGVGSFAGFSLDASNMSDNGSDSATGFGIRLGVQGEVSPGITLGAAFQPTIDMGEFDSYSGLFAEKGDFDIPSNLTVGLAWHITDKRVFLVDVQKINYSDAASVSNSIASLSTSCMPGAPASGSGCLGGSSGAGFGWDDMTIVKLGYQWQNDDTWIWRVGYSKTDQPISKNELLFNILAPGVIEEHLTFGFTRMIDSKSDFNFALMIAPNSSVKGPNTFEAPGAQEIEIEMDQYEIAASYSKRF
ncbi:MAG: long-chain fatty acid transport protein [Planctomycetota bacterium]|jgi:long-chain fatty acid transport protein